MKPDEILERLGKPAEGRYGSWHTELVSALQVALKQRDDLRACLEHAVELGYLGEGSTAGWAKDLLESIP